MNYFVATCYLRSRSECEIRNGKFSAIPVTSSQITDNTIFIFAPFINSIKNTFYCSNWCTLL